MTDFLWQGNLQALRFDMQGYLIVDDGTDCANLKIDKKTAINLAGKLLEYGTTIK